MSFIQCPNCSSMWWEGAGNKTTVCSECKIEFNLKLFVAPAPPAFSWMCPFCHDVHAADDDGIQCVARQSAEEDVLENPQTLDDLIVNIAFQKRIEDARNKHAMAREQLSRAIANDHVRREILSLLEETYPRAMFAPAIRVTGIEYGFENPCAHVELWLHSQRIQGIAQMSGDLKKIVKLGFGAHKTIEDAVWHVAQLEQPLF